MKYLNDLQKLANKSNGLIFSDKIREAGLPYHSVYLCKRLGWIPVMRGVWWPHTELPNFEQYITIGRHIFPKASRIGGKAGLYLQGALPKAPKEVDFWTSDGRVYKINPAFKLRLRRDRIGRLNRANEDGESILIEDCLADVIFGEKQYLDRIDYTIQSKLLRPDLKDNFLQACRDRKRLPNRSEIEFALKADPPFESVLEFMWVTTVELPHGIVPAQRQWICADGYRRDGMWAHIKAILELDGKQFHSTDEQKYKDKIRDDSATRQGFRTVRFTFDQVNGQGCRAAYRLKIRLPDLEVHPCSDDCALNQTLYLPNEYAV